ncbi:transposon ty3-I gag-pol polyprotein [Tanacetum coccineum]
METRHAADLKKILETIEADKKEMAQKMQAMQAQIQELLISQNHGEDSASSGSVNKRGAGSWHPNDIKVDIPEYDGKLDPDEFVEWLRTVERVEGKEKIHTWQKMKAKMKQKFLPTYYVQNSFSQLHSLRQGTGTAEEYSREFEYLLMKCDVPEDDPQTLVRYLGGLETRVANVVELHSYQTLSELTLLSHKVDSQQRSKGKFEPSRQPLKPNTYTKPTSGQKYTAPSKFAFPTENTTVKSEPPKAPRRSQKVCSMIIDGGSCTNVASQTLVTKLNLPTQPHPSPYVVQWLNQGKGIRVSHRVLLSFSIGKSYSDELWCDVIPMDACHVLLGRPWQFDRRVVHDGYLNTYSFNFNNRRIVLTPITPSKTFPTPTPTLNTILQSEHHEFQPLKEFILLGLDEEEIKTEPTLSPLIQTLLKSYSHVFPTEIPPGLPPKRSIQHKIDLMPGSVLPNKPAYRTNPQETIEIRKQVDTLIENGLIRESLSPCAVPTLLVPKKNGEWRMCMDSRSINKITIKVYEWMTRKFKQFVIGRYHKRFNKFEAFMVSLLFTGVLLELFFSTIVAPMTEVTRFKTFTWTSQAQRAFDELKQQLSSTPVLALPCFHEVFEVECDASGVGIGAVLSQLNRPIAYFSEKLNDTKRRYSTYDKEFYAIIRALDHWQHYLISKEFILHSDHEALKYIQGQHKLQPRHAKWVEFLQAFNFTIKHKSTAVNKGADALSRKYSLLTSLQPKVLGFDLLLDEYPSDPDFGTIYNNCQHHATGEFHLCNGFLFKTQQLCIPCH